MANYQEFMRVFLPYLADDRRDTDYCNGRFAYEWTKTDGLQTRLKESGRYEQDLEEFLSRDLGKFDTPEENLLILLGGIGTGKSTCMHRSLASVRARARSCSRSSDSKRACGAEPPLIHLDFRGWDDEQALLPPEQKRAAFWNAVNAHIKEHIEPRLSTEEEIGKFWPWCLKQRRLLAKSADLNRLMTVIEPRLQDYLRPAGATWPKSEIEAALLRDRADFIKTASPEALAWYSIATYAYTNAQKTDACRCGFLFVDNVDGLEPELQRNIVSLAQLLCGVLRTRTVVAVRPLTWKNTHGEFLLDVQYHYSPHFADVIRARIDQCLKREKPAEPIVAALTSLRNAVSSEYSALVKMMKATSGLSIRYALRNLYNMMHAPGLQSAYGHGNFIQDMKVAELAKAFFFGDRTSQISHAFENLYVCGSRRDPTRYLVKPRILDHITRLRSGTAEIREVFTFMNTFGHSNEVVTQALNELMIRSRPLLWCEEGFEVVAPHAATRVMITPVGENYVNDLFGEVYYDEICLARNSQEQVPLSRVVEFDRELSEIDLAEARRAIQERGTVFYQSAYGESCLSARHWRTLAGGVKALRDAYAGDVTFDDKREEWLREQVESVLAEV